MVKGVTRRVVVIKPPDRDIFEEAIFIVRDGSDEGIGAGGGSVVEQAQLVADAYIRDNIETRHLPRLPAPVYIALGALASALFMFIYSVLR